jgi:hypothetical protein
MNCNSHLFRSLSAEAKLELTRRQLLGSGAGVLGAAALGTLLGAGLPLQAGASVKGPGVPHFLPKAKRVIYLHMVGGPSQLDLFDYKPALAEMYDKDLPESVRNGQRLTGMTSGQARFPVAPSKYKFVQHGQSGMWLSELLPNLGKCVDDIAFIRSMHTEAINHEPAITELQTGSQIGGRPCIR